MTTAKFMVLCLCPGTDTAGPRAKRATELFMEEFPLTVTVNIRPGVAHPATCPKCGANRYKLTSESQQNTERIFGFSTKEPRAVCESMGVILRDNRQGEKHATRG